MINLLNIFRSSRGVTEKPLFPTDNEDAVRAQCRAWGLYGEGMTLMPWEPRPIYAEPLLGRRDT